MELDYGFKDTFTCEGNRVSTNKAGFGIWDARRLILRFNDTDYAPLQH
jgi:hypothetical protein